MNKFLCTGRLTRDPEVRYTEGQNATAIAKFTLAVDRRFHRDGDQSADFISCISFGKTAEHIEKYWKKGMKMGAVGRIQTGSYKNRDGQTVYTTDVVVEEVEFCESKASQQRQEAGQQKQQYSHTGNDALDGFMDIPDSMDEQIPFN